MLCKVERFQQSEKLRCRWIKRSVNVKVEVTKDEEFMWSSGSRCEKVMELIEKHR
jgi:hypothetical protein